MKILVIVDQDVRVEVPYLKDQLKEEITLNSVAQDGISIFQCGNPLPSDTQYWDWVGQVGVCNAPMDIRVDVEIPIEGDPIGSLITALAAVLEGMDTDEAIGESG